jgi:hypothetical protein
MAVKKGFDLSCQVRTGAVPDDQQIPPQLPQQLTEKIEGPIGVDVPVRVQAEVQVKLVASRRHHQRSNTRDLLVRAAPLLENRGVATRGPGPANQRSHQKAGFVHENQVRPQPAGFFLMRGHSFLIQRRISRSLRSTARRSGFCGLHPRARNKRQTPEIW